MTKNKKAFLAAAAIAGLMAGTGVTVKAASLRGVPSASSSQDQPKEKHACKGQNSCKGKGGCKASDNGCKAKNSCKGKGGCATDGSKPNQDTAPQA